MLPLNSIRKHSNKKMGGGVTVPHYYVDNSVLEHFGVKGMRWGVRKDREVVLTRPLPNGNSLTVYREPPSLIAGGNCS